MRRHNVCLKRCSTLAVVACGCLGAMYMGCGSSGTATSTDSTSGVAVTGSVALPASASSSEAVPLGKSLAKAVDAPSASIATLSTDVAVGAGTTVTITDSKTNALYGTGTTSSTGAYSINVPTTATDVIIAAQIPGTTTGASTTELNSMRTLTGVATSDVTIDANTTTASLIFLQKCKDTIGGTTDISVNDAPTLCGPALSAGTLTQDAIVGPYFSMMKDGLAAMSPSATTGSGAVTAQVLMFRELLFNRGSLGGQKPYDVFRKYSMTGDLAALDLIKAHTPTTGAVVDPVAALAYSKRTAATMATVNNDATAYAQFKADGGASIAKFFGGATDASLTKYDANPADLRSQFTACYRDGQTAKLEDKNFKVVIDQAVGDATYAKMDTAAQKAYMTLIYNTKSADITSGGDTVAKSYLNTVGTACTAVGVCDATKVQGFQNNPGVYVANIKLNPVLYADPVTGPTYATGLTNQLGTTTVITGKAPTFTACTTASDCGTNSGMTVFICTNNFCQNSAVAKATGQSCSYNGDCISGTCGTVTGATDRICKEPAVATGTTGGTLTALIANGGSCLAGYQCSSGHCNFATSTCAATTEITAIVGTSIKLGGLYKKGSTPTNVLSTDLSVTVLTGSGVSVSLSGGLYGFSNSATFSDSKLTFTMSVYDAGTSKTLTCTDVTVSSDGGTLSGTDVCTLAGTSKSINHTKQ